MTARIIGSGPDTDLRAMHFPAGTLRALQITDTHLYADPIGTLLGVNTLDSFRQVLAHFRDTHWPIDLLLATGDLVHDASPEGYRRIAAMLAEFAVPALCLPGNHDVPPVMHEHLRADGVSTDPVVDLGAWRFVMLDSVIPGEEGGHLRDDQLEIAARALADSDRHTLLCMHHQPVPVGSRWIDTMTLDNPAPLFEILDRHAHLRGVLWGHVHQTYEARRNGVRLMASPSTCVQFAPLSETFLVDQEPPGFRILALQPDGIIHSEVVRVAGVPQGLEIASGGY